MAHKAPGKHYRNGLSLIEAFRKFPDDAAAEKWFAECRWGGEPACPHCGDTNVQTGAKHPTMPYRCRGCRKRFSVRIGTAMQDSNIPLQKWAIGIYLISTSLKGVSSMKLHRDLDIAQSSAWHMAHRLREAWARQGGMFAGPVEVDETYVGGIRKNMPKAKRTELEGRGPTGKTAVVGVKDRESNRVAARVVESVDGKTLNTFVDEHTAPDAAVYTDGSTAYKGRENRESVSHSTGEYVRYLKGVNIDTNGVESFWSMLKRAHKGTFHKLSAKHLQRYVNEFVGRHNVRELDTLDQMRLLARGLEGKRLRKVDLTA